MAGMKRVITCVNIDGKSVVQSADVPQTVAVFEPGFILNQERIHRLWR